MHAGADATRLALASQLPFHCGRMSAAKPIPGVGRKRRWLRLTDRRVTKLTLLVALPMILVLLLAGYTALTSLSATAQTGTARQMVDVGTAGARLIEQLQQERTMAALLFAWRSTTKAVDAFRQQSTVTDQALAVYSAPQEGLDYSNGLAVALRRLNDQMSRAAAAAPRRAQSQPTSTRMPLTGCARSRRCRRASRR